ncbi:hypothetical protein Tco_1459071 [Tanacetum coccineum]
MEVTISTTGMDLYKLWKALGEKAKSILALHLINLILLRSKHLTWKQQIEKEKEISDFGIILEDARKEADAHQLQPISPNIKRSQTMNKDLQGMIKRPINSDKEDTNSNSSQDFTIIT